MKPKQTGPKSTAIALLAMVPAFAAIFGALVFREVDNAMVETITLVVLLTICALATAWVALAIRRKS